MKLLITIGKNNPQGYSRIINAPMEPAFQLSGFQGLWMNTAGWSNKATRYYAFEVKRFPSKLKNHVQRILHHLSRNDPDQLFGAMIDLFIVLGKHGQALKKRLLQNTRNTLQTWQYEQLHQCLQNSRLIQNFPPCGCSVLSGGAYDFQPLIEIVHPASLKESQSIVITEESDTYQQSVKEQQQLENLVLGGSKDFSLHEAITSLYQSNNDYTAFLDIFSSIEIEEQRLLDLWWATHEYLKEHA